MTKTLKDLCTGVKVLTQIVPSFRVIFISTVFNLSFKYFFLFFVTQYQIHIYNSFTTKALRNTEMFSLSDLLALSETSQFAEIFVKYIG